MAARNTFPPLSSQAAEPFQRTEPGVWSPGTAGVAAVSVFRGENRGHRPAGFAATYGFELLYEERPELDPAALLEWLRPEAAVELVSADDANIQIAHPEHVATLAEGPMPSLTNILRSFRPIEPGEFAGALAQTWSWRGEAEAAVACCPHRILVSDLTGFALPYQDRYRLIRDAVLAVAEITEPRVCDWIPAGFLVEPGELRRKLQWPFTVRLVEITDSPGDELMDTLGLAALGLPDAQCLFRGLDLGEMARWMFAFAYRIFKEGASVADQADVPGMDPELRWSLNLETAYPPPARPVIDVEPTRHHAGRRPR